ncbi:endonuclease/exonuclease/phosphatase family protein [Tsuneonella suprasediminis]|uniref:endonuclease/exonuclease/phosphatase family protein n=1 Tax=Tsuneonella suprasediminis TaxID=2306996 RepID=UPI000E752DF8|nr:endonuclease/exonuclease/phosphatase family protein [Tsuneonella suprasediminis]
MLRGLLALVLATLLAACVTTPQGGIATSGEIRAMTYNIRLDLASDGANAWPHRADMVAAVIRREAPDIIGMQEVLLHQKRDLQTALPDYTFIGVGRDDGVEAGEFSPLGWRKERFEAIDAGAFWLSPTPGVPGKGWDAAYPRIATWAVLRDRRSGQRIRVLNTHFDHVGTIARDRSAHMIADWVGQAEFAGKPTIVMGDFNAGLSSAPMAILTGANRVRLRDSRNASESAPYGPPGTFTGFHFDAADAEAIDHILVSPGFRVLRYAVITQHWTGRLPSDHYPVVTDLKMGRQGD